MITTTTTTTATTVIAAARNIRSASYRSGGAAEGTAQAMYQFGLLVYGAMSEEEFRGIVEHAETMTTTDRRKAYRAAYLQTLRTLAAL